MNGFPSLGPLGPNSQLKNCPWLKFDASFGISTPKLITEQIQNKFPSVFDQQTVYLTIFLKITLLPLPPPIGLTLRWYHHFQVDPSFPKTIFWYFHGQIRIQHEKIFLNSHGPKKKYQYLRILGGLINNHHHQQSSSSTIVIINNHHHQQSSSSTIIINNHHHQQSPSTIITINNHHHQQSSSSTIIIINNHHQNPRWPPYFSSLPMIFWRKKFEKIHRNWWKKTWKKSGLV